MRWSFTRWFAALHQGLSAAFSKGAGQSMVSCAASGKRMLDERVAQAYQEMRSPCTPPGWRTNCPAGGHRLVQGASGCTATIVNGVVTRRDDVDTGERPGRLVRGAR